MHAPIFVSSAFIHFLFFLLNSCVSPIFIYSQLFSCRLPRLLARSPRHIQCQLPHPVRQATRTEEEQEEQEEKEKEEQEQEQEQEEEEKEEEE